MLRFVFLLLLAGLPGLYAAVKTKGAIISLRARWNGTSYLAEAAEFMADEGLLWQFLSKVSSTSGPADQHQCWQHILDLANGELPRSMQKLLPLALSSRMYSAKVEMYRQLTSDLVPRDEDSTSCCLVDVGGKFYSSEDKAVAALNMEVDGIGEVAYEFDHLYGPLSASTTAILYGPPGAKCVGDFSRKLMAQVDAHRGKLALVYRPFYPEGCQLDACSSMGLNSYVWLSGYGVEAALKNTEYSAVDDAKKGDEGAEDEDGSEDGDALGEVGGFLLDTLLERRPEKREELLTLRDHLQSAAADEAGAEGKDLKVWAMRDLGLQATQRVAQASDPLALLMDISQNFPGVAPSLSRQRVNATLRDDVAHDSNIMNAGTSFLTFNGMAVDAESLDFYGLLERLRIEVRLRSQLDSLGLPPSEVLRLLELRSDIAGSPDELGRLKLSLSVEEDQPGYMPPEIVFCNDLETDRLYAHLPKKLKELLNTFPGRLRPIARNVYNLVTITEPLSPTALSMSKQIYDLYAESYPIRSGLAMVIPEVISRVKQSLSGGGLPPSPEWTKKSQAEQFALAFLTLRDSFGGQAAFSFWVTVSESMSEHFDGADSVFVIHSSFEENWKVAASNVASESWSNRAAKEAAKISDLDAWVQLTSGTGVAAKAEEGLMNISSYLVTKGIADLGSTYMWFNGGMEMVEGVETFSQAVLQKLMMEQNRMQESLYYGKIKDTSKVPVLQQIMMKSGYITRWNPSILQASESKALLPSNMKSTLSSAPSELLNNLSIPGHTAGMPRIHAATHYVIADMRTKTGRAQVREAMRFLSSDEEANFMAAESRVVLLPNPSDSDIHPSLFEALIVLAAASSEADKDIPSFILALLGDSSISDALDKSSSLRLSASVLEAVKEHAMVGNLEKCNHLWSNLGGSVAMDLEREVAALRKIVREAFGLQAGETAIFSNSKLLRVEGPGMEAPQLYAAEDFSLLQFIAKDYSPAGAITSTLQAAYDEGRMESFAPSVPSEDADGMPLPMEQQRQVAVKAVAKMDGLISSVVDILGSAEYPESRLSPKVSKQIQMALAMLQSKPIELGDGEGGELGVHIVAVLDPLSRMAQRISALLSALNQVAQPSISLRLNPQTGLTKLPITSYYRVAMPGADENGGLTGDAAANFARLPSQRILTLNMDVPEPWLVEVVQAAYDLDNLKLDDVSGGVARAEFELEGLTVTGSCIDVTQGANRGTPPRGLQIWMGTSNQPHTVDTLVMENLAYFQLKAKPGRWFLSLAPGRSQELYTLLPSADMKDNSAEEVMATQVVVSSLSGKRMILRVKKRAGMESEDVLGNSDEEEEDDEDEEDYYGWSDPSEKKNKNKNKQMQKQKQTKKASPPAPTKLAGGNATINVFTIASGHMYERLQKIMMLSVIRNTKRRVKFWIIKNYMSPHHRSIVPLMAKHYGFDYEFVTYKWPHWLHKQSEKQRIIWAYKILFLDVLFPLDVNRIIFVDSDQVVRADLGELMDMDIGGAPFAYTPFCDNNRDMDDFRFWKGGFWKDHLRGKPYHISALYLVDLQRFRQKAAGDNLRIVYEQLSRDPNSLANLDQDLPNYAQHSIPIFSLPQEWLWCESWCGNATKAKAKTIDLCNNPRTKEPKLSAARRIISEWNALDQDQAEFTSAVEAMGPVQDLTKEALEAALEEATNKGDAEKAGADKSEL